MDTQASQPGYGKGRDILDMTTVTSPIKDSYVLYPEHDGKGIAVYYYRRIDTWLCERCGSPQGTTRPPCLHIKFVKETL